MMKMNQKTFETAIGLLRKDEIATRYDLDDIFQGLCEHFPQQRIGQIFCNYICPDYRRLDVTWKTRVIMEHLFDIKMDPFFESNEETLARWKNLTK